MSEKLLRRLGKRDGTAIVIGTIIGTGIFLKTAVMSQETGAPLLVFLAWAVAAVLSLAGALTYAELGTLFPQAGGEYVFLRESYGKLAAFLYGWMRFWIGASGSIAAAAVAAATMIAGLVPNLNGQARSLIAVTLICIFTALNCLSVSFGGRLQSVLTSIKILVIFGLVFAILAMAQSHWQGLGNPTGITGTFSGFGLAVLAALWAFDGWNNLSLIGGEVVEPDRTVPFSLVIGTVIVFAIYTIANFAYFYALPFTEILGANSSAHADALPVATLAAQSVFGPIAVTLLSAIFLISITGSMNGSILTNARIPYAMAQDGLFFKSLARVGSKNHVPGLAVLAQGAWACVLAVSGSFDQLTDYVIFASWIFYGMVASSLFVFHRRGQRGSFRTPFYPWLPLLFVGCSGLLVVNTLYASPRDSLIGVAFIAAGVPAYYWFRWRNYSKR